MYSQLVPAENIVYGYKEYKSRWFMLSLFICALTSNIIFGFSLSPIAKELSTIYLIDDNYLQFLTVSFTIFTCVMIIPGNILNEKYGIRTTIVIGCILTLVGSIFAAFINVSIWFFFWGQLISLFGFPFRLISASKFVASWFYPENRIIIMVIISLLFNATSGLAIRLPLWVWGDYETDKDDQNYTKGRTLAGQLMLILMILMIILTVPSILFFKSKPATPPSFTASDQCKRENYMTAGRYLMKNRDYLILSLCFPFILGTITLFTLQMEYIVKPFDFQLKDISNAVGLGVLAGLIGDICVGISIKKTASYKNILRICNLLVTIFFGLMVASLLSKNKTFFFLCYFAVCGCSAIMALSFELACELSFPVSENTTIAFFGLFGNLINFSQAIPEILILKGEKQFFSFITMLIMFGIILSANYLTFILEEKLVRSQKDLEKDSRQFSSTNSQHSELQDDNKPNLNN